jgi:hypothetical protein
VESCFGQEEWKERKEGEVERARSQIIKCEGGGVTSRKGKIAGKKQARGFWKTLKRGPSKNFWEYRMGKREKWQQGNEINESNLVARKPRGFKLVGLSASTAEH